MLTAIGKAAAKPRANSLDCPTLRMPLSASGTSCYGRYKDGFCKQCKRKPRANLATPLLQMATLHTLPSLATWLRECRLTETVGKIQMSRSRMMSAQQKQQQPTCRVSNPAVLGKGACACRKTKWRIDGSKKHGAGLQPCVQKSASKAQATGSRVTGHGTGWGTSAQGGELRMGGQSVGDGFVCPGMLRCRLGHDAGAAGG